MALHWNRPKCHGIEKCDLIAVSSSRPGLLLTVLLQSSSLSWPYPQTCSLCIHMCSVLSKLYSFLQWCYWTLEHFILIALGGISFPFYRWRNRGTEAVTCPDLPASKLMPSVFCCLLAGSLLCPVCLCKLCLWFSSWHLWNCFPCHLLTPPGNVLLNPMCGLNSLGRPAPVLLLCCWQWGACSYLGVWVSLDADGAHGDTLPSPLPCMTSAVGSRSWGSLLPGGAAAHHRGYSSGAGC